jgi:hypothetical protein
MGALMLDKSKLYYVATPYSKYFPGIHMAFLDACVVTARLIKIGFKVYSPIAHTHPIAVHGNLDPLDHAMWIAFDETMMDRCDGLLVVTLHGWGESNGISQEIEFFRRIGRPMWFVNPETLEIGVAPSSYIAVEPA